MGDRPIGEGADGLRQVADETAPGEVEGLLDVVRGDMENVRRLVEQAGGDAGSSLLADLDAGERRMEGDVHRLGDGVRAAITNVVDELEGVQRPEDGVSLDGSGRSLPSGSDAPAVVHISGTDRRDAEVRRNPPPNSVVVVDDAFVYTTDELGRVVRAEATLTVGEPGRRNEYAQRTLKGKLPGDDAGHLIARVLGGLGDQLNLVPMTRKVNREEYAAMERRWRRAVEQGKTVDLEIELEYDTDARRPVSIIVSYEIAGQKPRTVPFDNDPIEETEP